MIDLKLICAFWSRCKATTYGTLYTLYKNISKNSNSFKLQIHRSERSRKCTPLLLTSSLQFVSCLFWLFFMRFFHLVFVLNYFFSMPSLLTLQFVFFRKRRFFPFFSCVSCCFIIFLNLSQRFEHCYKTFFKDFLSLIILSIFLSFFCSILLVVFCFCASQQ